MDLEDARHAFSFRWYKLLIPLALFLVVFSSIYILNSRRYDAAFDGMVSELYTFQSQSILLEHYNETGQDEKVRELKNLRNSTLEDLRTQQSKLMTPGFRYALAVSKAFRSPVIKVLDPFYPHPCTLGRPCYMYFTRETYMDLENPNTTGRVRSYAETHNLSVSEGFLSNISEKEGLVAGAGLIGNLEGDSYRPPTAPLYVLNAVYLLAVGYIISSLLTLAYTVFRRRGGSNGRTLLPEEEPPASSAT